MNSVDVVLAMVLAIFALRGYWRGFFRESFGLFALFGGLAVAIRFAPAGAVLLEPHVGQPLIREGAAFVGTFALTHALVTFVGFVLDRLAGATGFGLRHVAGAVVGVGKGGALAAFVLLFLHLFPLVTTLDTRIMESRLAPPLLNVAGHVVQFALTNLAPQEDGAKRA